MKHYIDGVLVLEGKEDTSYLSSFIEAEFVTTNGCDILEEEVDYLNHVCEHKQVLVLVDPDKAGREIEERLKRKLKSAIYLCVNISKCNRGSKNGVAECDEEEIIRILKPYFSENKATKSKDIQWNYLKIEFANKPLKQFICKKYHLGKCNTNTMIKRLNSLSILTDEIEKTIKEFSNDHQ